MSTGAPADAEFRTTGGYTGAGGPHGRMPPGRWISAHPWWITTAALVLFSVALVKWAGTRPGYDAYGWLAWGYQTLRLNLDLGGSPSWKPLPFLLTVPYALAGHDQLGLWMVSAVAVSLAGSIVGGRIAYRVVANGAPDLRVAPIGAAVFAGAAVLAIQDYAHYVLSAQTDPVIVTLTLAAIDSHLCGRRRLAFAFGVLAGLGRPEAWSVLGPYSVYLWLRDPALRRWVAAGWAVILFMWFGVPTITNGRPFVSAQLAFNSVHELRNNRIMGTLQRFVALEYLPIWLTVIGTVAVAILRRRWTVVSLAAIATVWTIAEIAFALHDWPGLSRYMFEPAAVCGVIGGIGFGWLLRGPARAPAGARRLAGPALALALVAVLVPDAKARYDTEAHDLRSERARTAEINALVKSFEALGGVSLIRGCGGPVVDVEWLSATAYAIHTDIGFVPYNVARYRRARRSAVIFTTLPKGGWLVTPLHLRSSDRARCAGLHAEWTYTRAHRGGVLIHLRAARSGRPVAGFASAAADTSCNGPSFRPCTSIHTEAARASDCADARGVADKRGCPGLHSTSGPRPACNLAHRLDLASGSVLTRSC